MSLVSAQEHRRSRRPGLVDPNVLIFAGYRFYTPVTIQASKVAANHSNFPFPIAGTFDGTSGEADLRTTANGGKIQNTVSTGGASGALTVPADFVVSPNIDGSTPYDHEFEKYDPATGEIVVWVKIPTMDSASNKTIYMVYGDSAVTASQENISGVWSNNYISVWHMDTLYDSAGSNNLSAHGSLPDLRSGKIGNAQHFDGNDHFEISDRASLEPSTFNLGMWVYSQVTGNKVIFEKDENEGYSFQQNGDNKAQLNTNSSSYSKIIGSTTIGNQSSWFRVEFNALGTDEGVYVNGLGDTASNALSSTQYGGGAVYIGSRNGNYGFVGYLDEIRFASVGRSSEWIATTYNSFDVSTFLSFGSEVAR